MDDKVFGILQSAVNLARNEQIRTVEKLKSRLLDLYPDEEDAVKQAIGFWAKQTRSN